MGGRLLEHQLLSFHEPDAVDGRKVVTPREHTHLHEHAGVEQSQAGNKLTQLLLLFWAPASSLFTRKEGGEML